ncbi:TPA: MarR family transcriptional regulator [Bacillus cereus]|nr:MarR family transcriptional regulator [Bacillus cereus]
MSQEAEFKAKQREQILSDEELLKANEIQAKANVRGMKLVPERTIKNRDRYVQLQQLNISYLHNLKYLTNAEKVLLFDMCPHVGIESNCIVDDVYEKVQSPLTITEFASKIGRTRNNVSPIINSLIDKGILARSETGLDNNNVRAYSLFVNPNIMYSGNRDSVNGTLIAMFKKVPKELKKLPVKMF